MQKQARIGTVLVNTYSAYGEDDLFILQEVYSKFIKEVSCPSKISFYNTNKHEDEYIMVVDTTRFLQDVDRKFVHKKKVVYLKEAGIIKFMRQNKKKIQAKFPDIFKDVDEIDSDLIEYDTYDSVNEPSYLTINTIGDNSMESQSMESQDGCSICFTGGKLYSIREFQEQYYNDMIDGANIRGEQYKHANCLIKCDTCMSKTCLFCLVKQTANTRKSVCCVCKQPNDIQVTEKGSNMYIGIYDSQILRTAMIRFMSKNSDNILIIQFDGMMGYRLIFQYNLIERIVYYDQTLESPQRTQYQIYKEDDSNSIHMFSKKDQTSVYLHSFDNVFQMLDVNTCRLISGSFVYTFNQQSLSKLEKYYGSYQKLSQLEIPLRDQIESIAAKQPQAKLAPKSYDNGDDDFSSKSPLMIFIHNYDCYCGYDIPFKAYFIYNKNQKVFKTRDVYYNLKKQGFRPICDHTFLEGIPKLSESSNVYTIQLGS